MCLYPKLIKNPKYKANKKNGGNIPAVRDSRVMAVPIGCGRCAECLKKKANEWKIRLFEETWANKNGQFVTLTFSNEAYKELYDEVKQEQDKNAYDIDNRIATLAVRRFLERWRKEYKKSVKHWLVTELGHEGTENIHLHGIIWTNEPKEKIRKHWKYGYVWAGYGEQNTYVNEQTINYITKYLTKTDKEHRYYIPKVLTSKGIGANYTKSLKAINNRFTKKGKTKDYYITKTGHKVALPIYYRNKLYNENEREELWLQKLDEETRYVDGIKIDVSKGQEEYRNIRKNAREKYIRLGYNGEYNWNEEKYENERRVLLQNERLGKGASGRRSPRGQVKVNELRASLADNDMSKFTNRNNWM